MVFDTHCHLTHPKLRADAEALVSRAREAGLVGCVTIGTGVPDARACLELAAGTAGFVRCSAGIDPFSAHDLGAGFDDACAELRELLRGGGFCAVGEIGLDYHYDLDPRSVQAERLEVQLALAQELDLPVVIHVREAHDDMARVLAAHPRCRGVIHSFTAGCAEAERYLELGWYLAFNGVATFNSGESVRRAAKITPADRLLVETDSPYLAPVPHRGKRCEPAYVVRTLEQLADVRGEPAGLLGRITTENAHRLFASDDVSDFDTTVA
ncbi:MAG: TatD family hydrolase [bacterium]|nr:TatD family hydrolase [bacterium]